MLTRKTFTAVAELLAWHDADIDMIEGFEAYFLSVNPNFDKQRFREYLMDVKDEMKENI